MFLIVVLNRAYFFFLKGVAGAFFVVYFNSSFAFGLRPLASFIVEGHLVFVAGVVSLALCDLVLMVGAHFILGGIATLGVVVHYRLNCE